MPTIRFGYAAALVVLLAAGGVLFLAWDGAPPTTRGWRATTPTAPHARLQSERQRANGIAPSPEEVERRDLEARMAAIEDMRSREEPEVLRALGRALSDPAAEIRHAAFRAVADMALMGGTAHELTVLLRQALADPDPHIRMDALDALAERGDEGLAAIRGAVTDPSEEVRGYARDLLRRRASNNRQ